MKWIGKKLVAFALTLCMSAAMLPYMSLFKASAADEYDAPTTPTQEVAKDMVGTSKVDVNKLYANGNDIVISEKEGKTIAKIGEEEIDISEGHWYVYGGSNEVGKNYKEVTITMNGGHVDNIIGSNLVAGHIETVNIIINGGTVGMAIGNRGGAGAGASSYDKRDTYSVGTANITVTGGTIQAIAGTYGYTYTKTVNMAVSGGTLTAETSPTQTGIILGGTNGEVETATLTMTGGKSVGVSLAQRTMIGKAVLNISGGEAGNIYAGSFYNASENSKNSWWSSGYGNVNYGQAGSIEVNIGTDAKYNDIYAGFQFYASEVEAFKTAYGSNTTHPAITSTYYDAPVKITLNAKADASYVPAAADKDNLSLLRAVEMKNITIIDNTIVPEVPTVDPEKPVEEVTVGVADETVNEVLNDKTNEIINEVVKNGSNANLDGVESNDSTPVAEKIADAVKAGKSITTQVVVAPVKAENIPAADKDAISSAAKNATIAQYLDLSVLLKADDEVIGKITKLSTPVTYTILLPEELLQQNDVTFYIIRLHDGQSDKIALTHVSGNQYSFVTDRYSTYALAYEKSSTPAPNPDPAVPTGDSANLVLPIVLFLLAGGAITATVVSKKKHAK